MVAGETLRLGQKVWYGDERKSAEVDALTRSAVGLILADGYVVTEYGDVYAEA